jgi:hypothetical protein
MLRFAQHDSGRVELSKRVDEPHAELQPAQDSASLHKNFRLRTSMGLFLWIHVQSAGERQI